MSLPSPEACKQFVAAEHPAQIAKRLRQDQRLCREGKLPTVLAHFVPDTGSAKADEIATHLLPQTEVRIPLSMRRLQYAGIVDGLKAYLAQMEHIDDRERTPINRRVDRLSEPPDASTAEQQWASKSILKEQFDTSELERAIQILVNLHLNGLLKETDVLPNILDTLKALAATDEHAISSALETSTRFSRIPSIGTNAVSGVECRILDPGRAAPLPSASPRKRKCYICRFIITDPHKLYPSLCRSCGNFNLAEGDLSLPKILDLKGRTALVTGGRINLGYHTALRLLRCGANVIVSTRYPQDAELRYRDEYDSESWIDRLRIVGADFRTAKDVFRLVGTIKKILYEWQAEDETAGRLFLLINNAAQTLTDPVSAEKKAIANEYQLRQLNIEGTRAVISNGYEATLRGGSLMPGGLLEAAGMKEIEQEDQFYESYSSQKTEPNNVSTFTDQHTALTTTTTSKSSWTQSLHEIPYEDIITAHSINTFVPLILIRELLPLMTLPPSSPSPLQPIAHILNISSREGIFERKPTSSAKAGTHVHTNMSKAGLNMITETEAAKLWTQHRIAMNTVDPGYMSAAPEVRAKRHGQGEGQEEDHPPLRFEDGAARVLWSVAVAEGKKSKEQKMGGVGEVGGREKEKGLTIEGPIWGRFLKHFGTEEVDVGLGR